jgi:excinuclease UvrABC helicase subunit UvrB
MNIDRDDYAERQARLDWMINEFRTAQTRRLMKRHDNVVESKLDTNTKAPLTGSAAPE